MQFTNSGPVPFHETWNVHDPSKVQEFIVCPRKYWFIYALGWAREGSNHHLIFGEGIHKAKEILLTRGYSPEAILAAYNAFLSFWRESFSPEDDAAFQEVFGAKSPVYVLPALTAYAAKYEDSDADMKVLHVEVAGSVPVSHRHRLHFRIDSILEDVNGMIRSMEHKTGSYLSQAWRDQWLTKHQSLTYTHVLMCEYGPEKVWGIEINGIIAQKGTEAYNREHGTGYQFERIPIRKKKEAMQAWLWEVNYYLDMIQWNFDELAKCSPRDEVMTCFPKAPESCTKYNRPCDFLPYCSAWGNPLKYARVVQPGFKQKWWDPREYRAQAGHVLDVSEDVIND